MENNNVVTWFEIPVLDMDRAKTFYAAVMQTTFNDDEINGMKMAIFKHKEPAVSGMLLLGENYIPSKTGAVVYLNGGEDLDQPLGRVKKNGGEILVPKTMINEGECGHFALFLDSEGNRVGLYSSP